MKLSLRLLTVLLLFSSTLFSQRLKKADRNLAARLKTHVTYLADDKLEGRRAGTEGEKAAREYISQRFREAGLEPKGENGDWYQPFEIYDGKQVKPSTLFLINSHDLRLFEDFFPLAYSPNASLEAAVSPALKEKDVPWFFDLKDLLDENDENPHFDLDGAIKSKAKQAAEKGATAFILYNSSGYQDGMRFNGKDRSETLTIPVLYITDRARRQFLSDEMATLDIRIKVDIGEKNRTGYNVIGYIDNKAPSTVIIGAHYDHLGYGEDGNSMLRNGEKLVHNGADDNASGTAALIELARILKQYKQKNNNYLFIAFSGEELGLNGSRYFTEHPTVPLDKTSYMINMDMVGRLNDSSKTLTVGGYGTSPAWAQIFNSFRKNKNLNIRLDSSGTGPSDHTSFYRKDIPVLFFFTGLHSDYHRPSDDADKINYTGQVQIVRLIEEVVKSAAPLGKLAFTKTREVQTSTTARFNVSMGIMPDYTYTGTGVRVDGVSDGRPAQQAGLKTGDVILQLGNYATSDMEAYMQALGKFKKGEKTTVKYKRGDEVLEAEVVF
jgi:Predicted aminopeptidases